jgi:hypothetical protein
MLRQPSHSWLLKTQPTPRSLARLMRVIETKHSDSNKHETVAAGSDYGQLCFGEQQFLLGMRSVDN